MKTATAVAQKLKSHREELIEMIHDRVESIEPHDIPVIVGALCYLAYEYPQAIRNMEAA